MEIADLDLFEVNEAFSAVVLRFLQAFDVDPARVNVNGGAIALGHPLGATGAMILGTALDELERSGKETALATLCVGQRHGRGDHHRAGVMPVTPVELSEVIRNYGLVAAGFVGILIAVWRALAADRQSRAQRDQVERRRHAADLFSKAVSNLDNEKLHIRLGAIYALRDIMEAILPSGTAVRIVTRISQT